MKTLKDVLDELKALDDKAKKHKFEYDEERSGYITCPMCEEGQLEAIDFESKKACGIEAYGIGKDLDFAREYIESFALRPKLIRVIEQLIEQRDCYIDLYSDTKDEMKFRKVDANKEIDLVLHGVEP